MKTQVSLFLTDEQMQEIVLRQSCNANQKLHTEDTEQFDRDIANNMPIACSCISLILSNTGDPIDYLIRSINEKAMEIYEIEENIAGLKGSMIYSQEVLEKQLKGLNQIYLTKKRVTKTTFIPELNKHCRFYIYSSGEYDITCLISEVTDLYKTKEDIEKLEVINRNIFENMPVGIELYDKDGNLLDLNSYDMKLFGINEKSEVLGINFFDSPNFNKKSKENIAVNDTTTSRFLYKHEYQDITLNIFNSITKVFDLKGNLENYIFINVDETNFNDVTLKLADFERMLNLVCGFGKIGYCHYDFEKEDGTAVNQWLVNLSENQDTDLSIVFSNFNQVKPEYREELFTNLEKIKKGEIEKFEMEIRLNSKQDADRWIFFFMMKDDSDKGNRFISINYDITPQKEIEKGIINAKEKAQTSEQLKSAFLANMSHEIRTPLNAIVGFAELIAECDQTSEKQTYLKIINENCDLLLQIISDILDLSRIEAGTLEFNYANVDINLLCEETVKSLKIKRKTNIDINFYPDARNLTIYTAPSRLRQVLINFLNNAIKFTKQGSITLRYEILTGDRIKFYVEDTGIGIDKKLLPSIFDRFVKLNKNVQGTGLGLPICKNIADQMGGEIGLTSEIGKGCTAWLIIPTKSKE